MIPNNIYETIENEKDEDIVRVVLQRAGYSPVLLEEALIEWKSYMDNESIVEKIVIDDEHYAQFKPSNKKAEAAKLEAELAKAREDASKREIAKREAARAEVAKKEAARAAKKAAVSK